MHFISYTRAPLPAASRTSLIALCFLFAAIVSSSAAEQQAAVTLQTLELEKPVNWYFISDIGLLHAHGDGEIHTFDLLDKGKATAPPLSFPLAEDPRSVVHLSGTSTLLIASARSGKIRSDSAADGLSSYGVDLPSGKLLWEQPSLALPTESYYFPEEDLVILESGLSHTFEGDLPSISVKYLARELKKRYTAVDRLTGTVRWSMEIPIPKDPDWIVPALVAVRARRSRSSGPRGQPSALKLLVHLPGVEVSLKSTPNEVVREFDEDLFESSLVEAAEPLYAYRVVMKDDTLLILGPSIVELDVRTGRPVWKLGLECCYLLFFPSIETAVHWNDNKSLKGYRSGEPMSWQAKIKGSLVARGSNFWNGYLHPQELGEDRFWIAATFKYETYDAKTGELLWTRKRRGYRALEPSPSGKLAAKIYKDKLLIVDLATGRTVQESKWPKQERAKDMTLAWINDTEFLIVYFDQRPAGLGFVRKGRRPTGLARYDCETHATVWNREVNARRPFFAAAARLPYGPGGLTLQMLQRDPPSRSSARASGGRVDQVASDAWARFVTVRERVARSKDRELRFAAGRTLNVLDLATGEISRSLSYEAPNVYRIHPDWGSGLWVIVENGGRRVKVVGERDLQSEPGK